MRLFLDDERHPRDAFKYTTDVAYKGEWEVVRNYDAFVKAVEMCHDQITTISFDHDLADEHYRDYMTQRHQLPPDEQVLHYDAYTEKTGYECAKWMIDFYQQKGLRLPKVKVHSMNIIGKQNILNIINAAKNIGESK